ncbi:hypothetical protein GCM10007036_37370 [Alsobacter metallidurans]|uniref:Glycoside hydrolase family 13 N-terminal domain-containing protein n=1 Tax=Alsobacter metallidurans TaxID=340221 RepID=A0A917IB44_9HYPH|nr:alpha/beta hydrolase-fold protein [Alsobacter metallidurans]GGH28276.1 hypothetical protein GCM10007036_37370 [Alsobacter metallidurans]
MSTRGIRLAPAALAFLWASPLAFAQQAVPPVGGVPADYCDSTCRAKRANPKPEVVSPTVSPDGQVTVKIWAPEAKKVVVSGLEAKPGPAKKSEDGVWTYTSPKLKQGYESYAVEVDGLGMLDPNNLSVVGGRNRYENMVEIGGGEEFARNDKDIPHGVIGEVFYRAPGVAFERRMRVYTPPRYNPAAETLPTLYLLHGGTQSEDQWPKLGRAGFILDKLIAEGKAKRMIIVMPDGYLDDFKVPSGALPELTTAEVIGGVMPFVEANYAVSKEPKDRAIAGLSRGAGQIVDIVRALPGGFGNVGVFSYSRTRVSLFRKELESMTADQWRALRESVAGAKTLYWSVGTEDAGFEDSKAIWSMLKTNSIDFTTQPRPGNHDWWVWRASLRDFAQKAFQ